MELKEQLQRAGMPGEHPRLASLLRLYQQVYGLPRHLGQHSGGMVLCTAGLNTIVPLEPASMPGRVVVVSEMSPLTRQIYLDKPQSDGGNGPMWNGHSVGHWEAKTLVVDTVNFQEPDDPIVFGGIRSASLHLVERYHLEDGGQTLIGEMTFEDPKLLTAPYTTRVAYGRLKNDSELWEYACQVDAEGWSERFKGDKAAK